MTKCRRTFHLSLVPLFFSEDLKLIPGHDTILPLRIHVTVCNCRNLLVFLRILSAIIGGSEHLYPLTLTHCDF